MFSFLFLVLTVVAHVVDLTDKNFKEFIENNEKVLVKFYAPWCPHCVEMAPEYEAASDKAEGKGLHMKFGRVDSTVHEAVTTLHHIQGFPTVKYFFKGKPTEYYGERDQNSLLAFCQEHENDGKSFLQKK